MPPRPSDDAEWVAIGRVRKAHGVRGELCVEPYAADPSRYASLVGVRVAGRDASVVGVRTQGADILVRLAGVDDRMTADALRGQELFVPRSERAELPEGRYYVDDLVGLEAVDTAGRRLGRVEEVMALPAHDVLRLSTEHGEGLVPMVRTMVLAVELEAGRVVLDPLPGLLPEPPSPTA